MDPAERKKKKDGRRGNNELGKRISLFIRDWVHFSSDSIREVVCQSFCCISITMMGNRYGTELFIILSTCNHFE